MLSCNRKSVERREVRSFTSRVYIELGTDATNTEPQLISFDE